jgi:hypothetical protein
MRRIAAELLQKFLGLADATSGDAGRSAPMVVVIAAAYSKLRRFGRASVRRRSLVVHKQVKLSRSAPDATSTVRLIADGL